MGDPGADQGAPRILAARHAQPARAGVGRVDEGADAFLGPEQLVGDRLIDHAGDDLAVALETDRNIEVRHAVDEIVGAVERIDDPAVAAPNLAGALGLAAFLAQETVLGSSARQLGAQDAFGLVVGAADEVAWALFGNLQILDLAEVALQALGRGEGGADHHRDGGRADGQRLALGRTGALAAGLHRRAADAGYGGTVSGRQRHRTATQSLARSM